MRPKVVLNRIRSFNDLFDDTTLFLKQNWRGLLNAYLYICAYPLLATLAVYGFEQMQAVLHLRLGDYTFGLTYFIRTLLTVINVVLLNLTVLSFMLLYKENENQAPEKTDVYHYVKYYFLRIAFAAFLLGIGLAIAFLAGFFPGVYFLPLAMLVMTIMVLENADLGYAFNRVFPLIKNHWWETAGALFLNAVLIWSVYLLLMLPVSLLAGTIALLGGFTFNDVYVIVLYISSVVFLFVGALSPILLALIYFHLLEVKGDKHLLERIEMLGRNEARTEQLQAEDY